MIKSAIYNKITVFSNWMEIIRNCINEKKKIVKIVVNDEN